jgi:hypothetical protein
MLGFRRCQAPYCRVSRTRTVWPREWRIAVPVWGLVHLACRPTPAQLRAMRLAAAMHRLRVTFHVNVESAQQAFYGFQQAMAPYRNPLGLPPIPQPDPSDERWEDGSDAQRVHFPGHVEDAYRYGHWVANPGRISRQHPNHQDG